MKITKIEHIHYENPIPLYDVCNVEPFNNFLIAGESTDLVSHNCAFIDEMNFAKAGIKDINKAKKSVKESYDAIMARIEGTFRLDGVVWGKLFAVSSKKTDQDFLEDHIRKQKVAGNSQLLVFDAPQWEILPEGTFSRERFWIAVGDKHRRGFVVQDESEEALVELRDQGYQLLEVPLDMKTNFLADFDVALRDLAGISVPGTMSFITQEVLDQCIGTRKNPFFQDILEIGTRDSYSIEDFFHWEFLTPMILNSEWFIHVDLSLNDDKTGIGASCITGRKDVIQDDEKTVSLPYFSHIFNISIKAPAGDKIPYAKITNFICWLRRKGAHIRKVTRDQYQSEYLAQLLEGQGFDVEKVSLDRSPDGYLTLRSVLMEERVDMLNVELLQSELIALQRNGFSGIPDHPIGGSKDSADGFAGSIWAASKYSPGVPVNRQKVASSIRAANRPKSAGISMPGIVNPYKRPRKV